VETRRMRPLPVSAMSTLPAPSTATRLGRNARGPAGNVAELGASAALIDDLAHRFPRVLQRLDARVAARENLERDRGRAKGLPNLASPGMTAAFGRHLRSVGYLYRSGRRE
jgi:hypothetical protein